MKMLALLLLFTGLGWSQIPEDQRSMDYLNGRYWMSMKAADRLAFIIGYAEAWGYLRASKNNPQGFPEGVRFGELRTAIDQFYAPPENLILPIGEAIWFWTKKANGEDPTKWGAEVASEIRFYHEADPQYSRPK